MSNAETVAGWSTTTSGAPGRALAGWCTRAVRPPPGVVNSRMRVTYVAVSDCGAVETGALAATDEAEPLTCAVQAETTSSPIKVPRACRRRDCRRRPATGRTSFGIPTRWRNSTESDFVNEPIPVICHHGIVTADPGRVWSIKGQLPGPHCADDTVCGRQVRSDGSIWCLVIHSLIRASDGVLGRWGTRVTLWRCRRCPPNAADARIRTEHSGPGASSRVPSPASW